MGRRQAVTRTRNVGLIARLALLAVVGAFSTLVAPGVAGAQLLDPERSGNEFCASSFNGYTNDKPWTRLSVAIAGAGSVVARMHAMPAGSDCIAPHGSTATGGPDVCPPTCDMQVQSVCELHCGVHRHSPPFPWTVRLTATPALGTSFVGWRGPCNPLMDVDRRDCVVEMSDARAVTAHFGAPDTTQPTTPGLTVNALGSYNLELAWTPSSDEWLAGYDVLLNGALRTRVAAAAKMRLLVSCNTSYSVQVVAFDFSGNEAKSAPVSARTGECASTGSPSIGPRPNTVLHVKPQRTTRSRTAFFHFGTRGEVKATRYQCKLDRGRWARCNASTGKRYRNLKKGYHTFRVRAGNPVGFDLTPAKWRWRIR